MTTEIEWAMGKQLVQVKQLISRDKCSTSMDHSIAEIELHFSCVGSDNSKSVRQHYVSMLIVTFML